MLQESDSAIPTSEIFDEGFKAPDSDHFVEVDQRLNGLALGTMVREWPSVRVNVIASKPVVQQNARRTRGAIVSSRPPLLDCDAYSRNAGCGGDIGCGKPSLSMEKSCFSIHLSHFDLQRLGGVVSKDVNHLDDNRIGALFGVRVGCLGP